MPPSEPDNPYAQPTAWTLTKAQPTRADAPSEPVKTLPPVKRNSIYSGSAIPLGPLPAAPAPEPAPIAEPRPHPEIAPAGEPPPPLRTVHIVAPPPAVRRRRSLRRHVPLIGSLVTAAAGFALVAFVLTRPAPELDTGPVHRPTHLALTRTAQPAGERPQLRGALQRLGLVRRAPIRTAPPAEVQAVSTAPVVPAATPAAPPAPKAAGPAFSPPPAPDPDAPIATRAPYS